MLAPFYLFHLNKVLTFLIFTLQISQGDLGEAKGAGASKLVGGYRTSLAPPGRCTLAASRQGCKV